jgi:tetratricopeptide (TPR) repeat protein
MPLDDSRLVIVVSEETSESLRAAADIADRWTKIRARAVAVAAPPARRWPFMHPLDAGATADAPTIVWMPDVHEAFVNRQSGGTRLVTTQAAFLMQSWLDRVAGRDVLLLATANRTSVAEHAPDLVQRRGPFQHAVVLDTAGTTSASTDAALAWTPPPAPPPGDDTVDRFAAAFRDADPAARLATAVRALDAGRTAPALVATASACMEVNDLDAAARDLDEATALAPGWAAVHFERGKLWLRRDDMTQAAAAFQLAADLMPAFGPAWANLGATLGELDRLDEALRALDRAQACDPASHQTVNNIGVLQRELGKLAESEASFRRVTALAPDLAFGYYNLGHTLFLQGRYQAALTAYVEGQKRDGERNPVQATRVAMCRLATGDPTGALAELSRAVDPLPRGDYRRQLLGDTQAIAMALLTHRPDLAGWGEVNAWLTRELGKPA